MGGLCTGIFSTRHILRLNRPLITHADQYVPKGQTNMLEKYARLGQSGHFLSNFECSIVGEVACEFALSAR